MAQNYHYNLTLCTDSTDTPICVHAISLCSERPMKWLTHCYDISQTELHITCKSLPFWHTQWNFGLQRL